MRSPRVVLLALVVPLVLGAAACNRNIEPYDPDETVRQPDLSRIFPEGAERAAAQEGPAAAAGRPGPGIPPAPAAAAAGGGAAVTGTIRLAPELADRVPSGAVLFLIARTQRPGPPLAVKRLPAPRFPFSFEIGPGDRMIQEMPFEGPLRLTARLDADGNARADAGDLEGQSPTLLQPGDRGVEIVIDRVL